MTQKNNKNSNQLELYLKNMDLLKIYPSVAVNGYQIDLQNKSEVHALLNLLSDWSIRELYLFDEIDHIKPIIDYFESNGADTLLKSIKLFINFNPSIESYIYAERDNIESVLQPKIFCTKQYLKNQKAWGRDVFHFYGTDPEIYEIYPGRKSITLNITNPEDVFCIYKYPSDNKHEFDIKKCKDILSDLDLETGALKITGLRETDFEIIVLRICQVIYDGGIKYEPNFLDENNLNKILSIHKKALIDSSATHLATVYELTKILPDLTFDKFINLFYCEKSKSQKSCNQEIINLVLTKYLTDKSERDANHFKLKSIYLEHLKEKILPKLNTSKKNINFFLSIDHPLYSDLIDFFPIIAQIDASKFLPETPYELKTIINLKKLVNACLKIGMQKIPVTFDNLFNIDRTFDEKKFNIDYLFLKGANHVNFSLLDSKDMGDGFSFRHIKKWDPNYPGYFDWVAYIHQLGHFFKLGIKRSEMLIIYPSLDPDLDLFYKTICELEKTGLDYDIIDFDTFNNNAICAIQDGEIVLYNHNYRLVLLPAVDRIPVESLQKINKYYANGGIIIALGRLPKRSKDDKKVALLNRIKKQIWMDEADTASTMFKQHESGGLGYFQHGIHLLKNIFEDLHRILRVKIDANIPGIKYQIREINENYFIFLLNTHQNKSINFNFQTKYIGKPYCWNFSIGESAPCSDWQMLNNHLNLNLKLKPRESRLYILDKKQSLKIYQIVKSQLDGNDVVQQDGRSFQLEGWQRQEGKFNILVQKLEKQVSLSYNVAKKLPILAIDSNKWYLDSEHFNGQVSLGDQGYPFPYKSTSITYHKLIVLKPEYLEKKKLFLDIGKVNDWCSVYINEEFIERRLFSPWIFEITNFVKEGENKITIQVSNKLSNRLAENSEMGSKNFTVQEYGLFGPVKIIPYSIFTFKI